MSSAPNSDEPPIGYRSGSKPGVAYRWERLLRNGLCVGYRRELGRAIMFSKDGYGWSAESIEHDQRLAEANFGGASLKVFHGDIIEMPYRYDHQENRSLVVMITDTGDNLLYDLHSGDVDTVEALWPPPNRPFVHKCCGSVWTSDSLSKRCNGVLRALNAEEKPGFEMVVQASVAFCLGVASAALIQWLIFEEVGPLTALFGGLLSSLGLLTVWHRLNPYLFSRKWSISMTWRVALFCGLNVMLVAFFVGYSFARIVGLGTAGILSSGLIWLLSSDLVAWRSGGYERDTKTSRRPGARWD